MEHQEEYEELERQLEEDRRIYKKGLRKGICLTLVVVLLLTAAGSIVLRRNGFVFTSFAFDKKLTGEVLSEPVQKKVART